MKRIDKHLLEMRRRRVHHAIKAKRVLGEWIPPTGPIEDADKILNQMRHGLINARVGVRHLPNPTQNMFVALKRSSDLKGTLMIYISPSVSSDKRRRSMTARRIAHRLGYLPQRADSTEEFLRSYNREETPDA